MQIVKTLKTPGILVSSNPCACRSLRYSLNMASGVQYQHNIIMEGSVACSHKKQ
jgi:hypothetical protein